MADVVLDVRDLRKDYGALRPLRVQRLEVRQGQSVALLGFDRPAAEVFVNLLTGAVVPDAGDVHAFGQSTRDIADGDTWLASLDRYGILSERAVLLEEMTVAQNLAVPFSLALNPIPPEVQSQVEALAADVELAPSELPLRVADVSPLAKLRVRLGRAVALNPRLLLAEHPTALLPEEMLSAFSAGFVRLVRSRGLASVVFTADARFASAVAADVLTWRPATGELAGSARWWTRWNKT